MKNQLIKPLLLVLLCCSLVLGACNQNPYNSANASDQLNVTNSQKNMDMKTSLPRLSGKATVKMVVNNSPILIEVDGDHAPITAGNFIDLVNRGVYNGLAFHRIVKEPQPFVVQGGDPQSKDPNIPISSLGTGSFIDPETGDPRYIPLEIEAENSSEPVYSKIIKDTPILNHRRGAVAMARSQMPDSASSQFYFALADLGFLDGQYAVFGYVTEGMEVVDQIKPGDRIQSAEVISGIENLQV
jgi:peptidyl-prolyl cis-trans isomerase B (cyclophilin B)